MTSNITSQKPPAGGIVNMPAAYLVGKVLLPQTFGSFTPWPQRWDLDRSKLHAKPVLLRLPTAKGTIKAYYVATKEPSDRLVVGFHGNTRSVAVMMGDFWQHFGAVNLLLCNIPGYGTLPEDQSQPVGFLDVPTTVARFEAMVDKVREVLQAERIDWAEMDPQEVTRVDDTHEFRFTPFTKAALPFSFRDYQVTVFGRSVGAVPASRLKEYRQLLFSPFINMPLISAPWKPVGPLLWTVGQYLAGNTYNGFETTFNKNSVCIVMENEELVGIPDMSTDMARRLIFKGATHATVPDEWCHRWFRAVVERTEEQLADQEQE